MRDFAGFRGLMLDGSTYRVVATWRADAVVRAGPFDAIELELAALWERQRALRNQGVRSADLPWMASDSPRRPSGRMGDVAQCVQRMRNGSCANDLQCASANLGEHTTSSHNGRGSRPRELA